MRQRDIANDLILRHVDDEPSPPLGLRAMFGHKLRDRQLVQHAYWHIDGELEIEARVFEYRPIVQRRQQGVLAKLGNAFLVDIGQKSSG